MQFPYYCQTRIQKDDRRNITAEIHLQAVRKKVHTGRKWIFKDLFRSQDNFKVNKPNDVRDVYRNVSRHIESSHQVNISHVSIYNWIRKYTQIILTNLNKSYHSRFRVERLEQNHTKETLLVSIVSS